MSDDPIVRLSKLRIISRARELEAQLADKRGGAVALEILRRLKDRAADSLAALPFLNVYDPKDRIKIVTMQNEVKRYDEWIGFLRDIISEGITFERDMSEQEHDEMIDLLMETPEGARQAAAMGLIDADPRDE